MNLSSAIAAPAQFSAIPLNVSVQRLSSKGESVKLSGAIDMQARPALIHSGTMRGSMKRRAISSRVTDALLRTEASDAMACLVRRRPVIN